MGCFANNLWLYLLILQGNFQFIAVIENWRSVFYTHNIDVIIFDWILPLNIEFIQKTLKGIRGNSILTVSVRVLCTNGLLCQNCTQICGK